MKKAIALIMFVAMLTLPVMAADYPKAEVFGGYQFSHHGSAGGYNANGWNGSLAVNLNKWFGVAGDFSGFYSNVGIQSGHTYSYTGGPVLSLRQHERFTPFVHALFGGYHSSTRITGNPSSSSVNGLMVAVGGGVDVKVARHVAIRAPQFDWLMFHGNGVTNKNNVRLSTGIVFRF